MHVFDAAFQHTDPKTFSRSCSWEMLTSTTREHQRWPCACATRACVPAFPGHGYPLECRPKPCLVRGLEPRTLGQAIDGAHEQSVPGPRGGDPHPTKIKAAQELSAPIFKTNKGSLIMGTNLALKKHLKIQAFRLLPLVTSYPGLSCLSARVPRRSCVLCAPPYRPLSAW